MSALPPSFPPSPPRGGAASGVTGRRWGAVHEAARVVAMLAGEKPETPGRTIRDFPALVRDCDPWRRAAAEQGVADLAAIMEPGLATLLAINARGNDCSAAAQALWREFLAARTALIELLPPAGAMGPRRSA